MMCMYIVYHYRPQRSCGKVMFLHLAAILFTRGGLADTPQADNPTPRTHPTQQTATVADGTHPTGMHSCSNLVSEYSIDSIFHSMDFIDGFLVMIKFCALHSVVIFFIDQTPKPHVTDNNQFKHDTTENYDKKFFQKFQIDLFICHFSF